MHELAAPGTHLAIRSAVAPLLGEPRISSTQISQRVSGEPLEVLERSGDDWLRVRGDDAYEGWVHRGYVEPLARFEPDRDAILVSLDCVTEREDGTRRRLPVAARLWPDEHPVAGFAVPMRELPARFPLTREAVAGTARDLFSGAPYEWGGVTPWGADCSGFVQTVFGLHGITLPRDAWQQALVGTAAGTDPRALPGGDLLFFSDRPDGRITHVGIALGGGAMAHSALGRGGNTVDVMTDVSDGYVRALVERFRFARALDVWSD